MNGILPVLRRASRWTGASLTLWLGAWVLVGGLHQHSDLREHDACVLCTVAHAPAVSEAKAPTLEAPLPAHRPIHITPPAPRATLVARDFASRAPPSR